MSNVLIELEQKGLVNDTPNWLSLNTMYLTIMGSHSYGVADTSTKDKPPDYDIYGWAIPPKEMIFPHLTGYIRGFGHEPPNFDKPYQKHHIFDKDALGGLGKEWDVQVFGIVQFFELLRENNPNIIDSLYTPENCVIHVTPVGRMVRENRKLFLSKLAWKKFRGYAHDQIKKSDKAIKSKEIQDIWKFEFDHEIPRTTSFKNVQEEIASRQTNPPSSKIKGLERLTRFELLEYEQLFKNGMAESTRFEGRKIHGQDNKFLYHILRLFDEAEQILLEGEINLQRAKEPMKAVRRGEWTLEQITQWTIEKDKALEVAYVNCKLPERPPIEPIQKLLTKCLEEHYGSLDKCVSQLEWAEEALKEVDNVLNKHRKALYS